MWNPPCFLIVLFVIISLFGWGPGVLWVQGACVPCVWVGPPSKSKHTCIRWCEGEIVTPVFVPASAEKWMNEWMWSMIQQVLHVAVMEAWKRLHFTHIHRSWLVLHWLQLNKSSIRQRASQQPNKKSGSRTVWLQCRRNGGNGAGMPTLPT